MRNLFAAIELRVDDYSSDIRKSLRGKVIGQIGCFARGGYLCARCFARQPNASFRQRRRGPGEAHLLPLSPLRCSAAPHLSRSRHLLPREKSRLALPDGGTGSLVGCERNGKPDLLNEHQAGKAGFGRMAVADLAGTIDAGFQRSSRCRGQSSLSKRDSERSARIRPFVWQPGQ